MQQNGILTIDSTNIQTHLSILQGIISRLAGNSALCKTLCITLTAAVVAIAVTSENTTSVLLIAVFVTLLFCALDVFYLSLEREYRNMYNNSVEKLHDNTFSKDELFVAKRSNRGLSAANCWDALKSWSISFFYLGIIISIFFVCCIAQ
ncbi:hypothetical protein DGI_2406 [Megalodesulfovibrio gigas DSM 1382 = ATCC 19364]|uniref:Uncharacterized protein n=1 Tax=Megalodesulfovibrio gigas (strain ATCC 19364 / DSM 1382 / NCIMB 9332 / VKM B-1759) TaxID=1121448 RepID=T2GC60_MEGG1|nr:hypothetical protein DGI_2406 [Megalodesulfovibrio gigas DSM 1382 = ATCC 19364]